MKAQFTGEMTRFSLILALLLISVSQCAILPQNFGSSTLAADFKIPSFPEIKFPTITIPTFPTITPPTFPSIPTPTFPTFPTIPTPTFPTFPTIPTPTFPTFPEITFPTFPTFPVIPVDPCGLKPFCGLAANFKTQAELKAFVDTNCPNYWIYPMFRADASTAVPQAAPSAAPTAQRQFSGTNNQQARVDQADILKTDGEFIYSISGRVLSIIKAYPTAQTKILSTIFLKNNPGSLFIDGNYLNVFGTDYEQVKNPNFSPVDPIDPIIIDPKQPAPPITGRRPYPLPYISVPYTWVDIYDISKKASPKLIKNYTMAGYYSNGRKSEETGFVYLLSNQDCRSGQSYIPWYNFGNGKKNMTLSQIYYYPVPEYNSVVFTNLLAFNLRNPLFREENAISFLTLNSWVIYMSEKFLYMTSTQWTGSTSNTKIHKVYVFRSSLIPMADGSVPGSLEKQFWMDEYNYDLRVATTQTNSQGISSNNVFCLDFSLRIIGSVRNIAINETIFSARYMDTRLYLVTFRRIDPFFVIDLANHRLPRVLGELKISGFSNYLHPYDNRTIIGFGQETNDQGQQTGLKVSLFDVTNVRNPTSVADYVLPIQYSYSTAQWEHKAFLFSKEKNLMVVPAQYYNWQDTVNGPNSFNGAMVFDIRRTATGGSIQLRAIVNHLLNSADEFWQRSVERSLYIENMLYTKSNCLMRVHNLTRLDRVLNLNLNCEYDNPIAPASLPNFAPGAPLQISGTLPVV